jgi:hypothetical protein
VQALEFLTLQTPAPVQQAPAPEGLQGAWVEALQATPLPW